MTEAPRTRCPRCGTALRADEFLCPQCLLSAGAEGGSSATSDRIFQEALALEPGARRSFIAEATRDNPALASTILLLLKGYEESGGDSALPTLGDAPHARAEWAMASNEEPGTVIDHFRLVSLLGEGGMGSVWRAEQIAPVRRMVALKIIKLGMDTRQVVRRFERERQTLALLNHPHIAQVFEAGSTALGRPYFAMELVEGEPITAHCESAGLDLKGRLRLFRDVCAAVEHAHQKGVIHRDLKPTNILVAGGVVKIIDFGVAKATQNSGEVFVTQQAQVLGTPAYMSPEQAGSAGADVDTRTDVYALGVVLYEMLTGALPIDSERLASSSIMEMQRIITEEDPPMPSARSVRLRLQGQGRLPVSDSALRGDLDRVVMKAIRKERAERYQSAAAFSEDIRRYLAGEPVSAAPPTLAYVAGKFVRRNRTAVAAAGVVVLTLLAGLVVSLEQVRRTQLALAGESRARAEATFTLSDMYARSGLTAAENGDATRAALWFANAAIIGGKDPARAEANLLRATTWRQEAMTAVRAFSTGFDHLKELIWNPRQPALIVQAENTSAAQIWNLETEQQWPPALGLKPHGAAWSPTGEQVALFLAGEKVVVLQFPSGRELARTNGMLAASLSWSPDGRWVAGGNLLWDWQHGATRRLPAPARRIRFSRDGRYALLQWESKTGICAVDQPGQFLYPPVPARPGDRSDFLGDGQLYFVGQETGDLVIRDSATGAILETHPAGSSTHLAGRPISASADGRFIARRDAAVLDRTRPGSGKTPLRYGERADASFSPDALLLASGGYHNRLELWSVADGKFLGEVGRHHTAVVNVAFSPNGRWIASGEDGLVRVWQVERPKLSRRIPFGETTLVAFSRDGKILAPSGFSNRDGKVRGTRAFDIATGQPAGPEIDPGGLIMDAVFSPEDAWLALAVSTTTERDEAAFKKESGTGNVQFWNYRSGERLGEPIALPSEPRGLAVHPSGRWLGVGCAGNEGVEIDLPSRTARVLFDLNKPVHAGATLNNGRCAYSPDGRVFAVWGLYEFIHLWDREQGRHLIEPREPRNNTFDLAFHGDTVARAVVGGVMRIEFRNPRTGAEVVPAIPYVNWPFLTRFSADGNLLLTAGGGKAAQVWDWRKGQLICPALPHDETIMAGCFVPGTPWVITGAHDGKIKFWDRRSGMMIRPPLQHQGEVFEVQLTSDARTVVSCGLLGGNIELIDLPAGLPKPDLTPDGARLLAEIDADAEVHPGGGLAPLPPQAWLSKWQEFRKRFPNYAGHRLTN